MSSSSGLHTPPSWAAVPPAQSPPISEASSEEVAPWRSVRGEGLGRVTRISGDLRRSPAISEEGRPWHASSARGRRRSRAPLPCVSDDGGAEISRVELGAISSYLHPSPSIFTDLRGRSAVTT